MSKIFVYIGILLSAALLSCGPTAEDAREHDRAIRSDKTELDKMESAFINTILDQKPADVIKSAYKKYNTFLNDLLKKYQDMHSFDEKDTLRKAMIDYIEIFKAISEKEYAEMLKMFTKDYNTLTKEDFKKWGEYTIDIDSKITKANDKFNIAEEAFAKDYKINLRELPDTK